MQTRYQALLNSDLSDEQFTRQALGLLEAHLREMALLSLHEWLKLDIISPDLFNAVANLRFPSWGSWNGLLVAVSKARNKALQQANVETRERIEKSPLTNLINFSAKNIKNEVNKIWLPAFYKQSKQSVPSKPSLKSLLSTPIWLRNRISHDNPIDLQFWQQIATTLQPAIQWLSEQKTNHQYLLKNATPWFIEENNQHYTFNGISSKGDSLNYVSDTGRPLESKQYITQVLLILKKIMGKEALQEADFRQLLGKLAPEESKGVLIGDYLVGKFIAEGAHGTVHKGIQLSTGRHIAIKFLKEGLSEDVRLRFKQEAKFLSHLNHPHIVDIISYAENEAWHPPKARQYALDHEQWYQDFSQGKKGGIKTFIAMEWIAGQTLDEYYLDKKNSTDVDFPHLTQWFIDVCTALTHVHQSDIIHRDIKPSNLMINEQGIIKLMDFGIARSYEQLDARLTRDLNARLGSPAYMSPEQIKANETNDHVAPASDIYGLSAVFYELYTQHRLYDHDNKKITVDTITALKTDNDKKTRPTKPIKFNKTISLEINDILSIGLEHEISDRYTNTESLKRDLVHVQKDEPIEKKRPTNRRRLRLWYRRNHKSVNISSIFTTLLIGATLWYIVDITQAEKRIRDERDRAIGLINYMNFDLRDKLDPIGRLDIMNGVQTRINQFFDGLDGNNISQNTLHEKAIGLMQHASTLELQGKLLEAEKLYLQAHKIYKNLVQSDSSNTNWQSSLSVSYNKLGDIYLTKGKLNDALKVFLISLGIRKKLIDNNPRNSSWQLALSVGYERLGDVYLLQGKLEHALKAYLNRIKITKKLVKHNPKNTNWQRALSVIYNKLGNIYATQNKLNDAFEVFLKSMKISKKLVEDDPSNSRWQSDLSTSYVKLGDTYSNQGKLDNSLKVFLISLSILKKLTKDDPSNNKWQHNLLVSYIKLGDIYSNQGKLNDALKVFLKSINIAKKLTRDTPKNTKWQRVLSVNYNKLGNVYLNQGNLDKALKVFLKSIKVAKKLTKKDPNNTHWERDLSVDYNKLGNIYLNQGNLDKALEVFLKSTKISKKLIKKAPNNINWKRDLSISYHNLGGIYLAQGKLDDALKVFLLSFDIDKKLAEDDPNNANSQRDLSVGYIKLGNIYLAQNKLDDALRVFLVANNIYQKLVGDDPSNTNWQYELAVTYQRLGDIYSNQGKLDNALKSFLNSFDIDRKLVEKDPSNTNKQHGLLVSYIKLGEIYSAQNKLDKALKTFFASLEIAKQLVKNDLDNTSSQYDLSVNYEKLANIYKKQKNIPKAIKLYKKSLAISKHLADMDKSNTDWQRGLVVPLIQLMESYAKNDQLTLSIKSGEQALVILNQLQQKGKLYGQYKNWLKMVKEMLNELKQEKVPN